MVKHSTDDGQAKSAKLEFYLRETAGEFPWRQRAMGCTREVAQTLKTLTVASKQVLILRYHEPLEAKRKVSANSEFRDKPPFKFS